MRAGESCYPGINTSWSLPCNRWSNCLLWGPLRPGDLAEFRSLTLRTMIEFSGSYVGSCSDVLRCLRSFCESELLEAGEILSYLASYAFAA